jgi:hypothetical protein
MNKLIRIGCLAALMVCASVAIAAESNPDEHASHHPPAAQPASKEPANAADPMAHMEENAKRMHDLMSKMRTEKNRTERQKLMRQHMTAMRQQMNMMREMKMPSGLMAHHQMMQKRHEMMQMMMDQMLQHQELQENSPTQHP